MHAFLHNCIYMHTSIYAYNANWGASTNNRSKANRKSLRNRPQNGPKSVPNRPKIDPRSASEQTSLPTSILDRLGTVFGPFWARSCWPLGGLWGGQVGVKLDQKSIFGGPGWRSKTNMMLDTFLNRFLVGLGAILGSKIDPKSVQNRSQERSSRSKNV